MFLPKHLPYFPRKWFPVRQASAWFGNGRSLDTTTFHKSLTASRKPSLPRQTLDGIAMLRRIIHLEQITSLKVSRDKRAKKRNKKIMKGKHGIRKRKEEKKEGKFELIAPANAVTWLLRKLCPLA